MNADPRNSFLFNRLPWVIAVVASLALGYTVYHFRGVQKSGPAAEPALDQIVARLDALEARQSGSRSIPNSNYPPVMGGDTAIGGPGIGGSSRPGAPGGLQKTPQQLEIERKQRLQQLETEFSHDAADPSRGALMQNAMEKVITSPDMASTGIKPANSRIDCRAHLCRVSANFAKSSDAEDWATFYLTAAGGHNVSNSQVVFVPQAGGGSEARIFAKRNDH
jgi:hypothetical protein